MKYITRKKTQELSIKVEGSIKVDSEFSFNKTHFEIFPFLEKKNRTLLADDDTNIQNHFKTILPQAGNGPELIICFDAIEALERPPKQQFELIVKDNEIPHMSGVKTAQNIRGKQSAFFSEVPIIAFSTQNYNENYSTYIALRMSHIIPSYVRFKASTTFLKNSSLVKGQRKWRKNLKTNKRTYISTSYS